MNKKKINDFFTFRARNAQAARNFLKPKEYGKSSSKNYYFAISADDIDMTYEGQFKYINSMDQFIPKRIAYTAWPSSGGLNQEEYHVSLSTCSVIL